MKKSIKKQNYCMKLHSKLLYETALNKNGYQTKMTYTKTTPANNKKRAYNITWFNPTYSQNIKANIGKIFLKFIKKHFRIDHRLII